VHVQVNDQYFVRLFAVQQIIRCHGKIIQQAKPFSPVCICMMCATCHIHGNAVFKSVLATVDSALCYYKLSLRKLRRLRKPNMPLFPGGKRLGVQLFDVLFCMGVKDYVIRCRLGGKNVLVRNGALIQ
jgi:hypothetical protein